MEYSPITTHIAAMLERLGDSPRRAVYMVVKELYRMDTNTVNNTISEPCNQGNVDIFVKRENNS